VCFFNLAVDKARLRYRSLPLTTNFKVALQVESTIRHLASAFGILLSAFVGKLSGVRCVSMLS
jgi:hypothetical protein